MKELLIGSGIGTLTAMGLTYLFTSWFDPVPALAYFVGLVLGVVCVLVGSAVAVLWSDEWRAAVVWWWIDRGRQLDWGWFVFVAAVLAIGCTGIIYFVERGTP